LTRASVGINPALDASWYRQYHPVIGQHISP